jgi:hypothetical protein
LKLSQGLESRAASGCLCFEGQRPCAEGRYGLWVTDKAEFFRHRGRCRVETERLLVNGVVRWENDDRIVANNHVLHQDILL